MRLELMVHNNGLDWKDHGKVQELMVHNKGLDWMDHGKVQE